MVVVWWVGVGQPGGVWLTLAVSDGVAPEFMRATLADMRGVVVNGLALWV